MAKFTDDPLIAPRRRRVRKRTFAMTRYETARIAATLAIRMASLRQRTRRRKDPAARASGRWTDGASRWWRTVTPPAVASFALFHIGSPLHCVHLEGQPRRHVVWRRAGSP